MAARDTERSSEMQSAQRRTQSETGAPPAGPVQTVKAADLLGPSRLLRIELDGEIYTLRLTRNHRLILTK
jgi:hemin uptake protein HemP